MMTGHGKINEWGVCYTDNAKYKGYIEDEVGHRFHVSEHDALPLVVLMNQLIEALADIADRYDTYDTIEAKSLCSYAYDELYNLEQIIPDETGFPKAARS